jgi:hypothetical protein
MTMTSTNLVSPFLSSGGEVAKDGPRMHSDVSAESMRRLRDPFAVDSATTRATTTGDEAGASR